MALEQTDKDYIDVIMWEVHPEEEVTEERYKEVRGVIEAILIEKEVTHRPFLKSLNKCAFYWYLFGLTNS